MFRKSIRSASVASLGISGLLIAAACSTGNTTPEDTAGAADQGGEGSDSCKIGMTQINQTAAFFTQMNQGAQEAADELGCELMIANANNQEDRQSNDIENFTTQQMDGIIVVAIDVNGVAPAVDAARAEGIPVVAIDAELENVETFVGVDNLSAGKEAGEWVVDHVLEDGTRYGIVDAKNSFIQNLREEGFREVVEGAGAEFVQSVNGENIQEKGAQAALELLTAHSDLDFIYTTGEPMTVGAVAGLPDNTDTVIIGWDLTKEVIAGIDDGVVNAVIQQDPKQEGYEAVKELKAILSGEEPSGFIDVPITIVTDENVDDFRAIFD